jgi:hypothetical protein
MGGLTIILGVPLPYGLLYYIPIALPTTTSARIQITNRVKALNGLFILWGFLIVVQIYGNISILPKKGELLFPLCCVSFHKESFGFLGWST